MQMNRRQAITTIAVGAAALGTYPWTSRAEGLSAPLTGVGMTYPFSLPPLPYAPDAVAAFIDAETMNLHHGKHHAGYVTNLNKALESAAPDVQALTLEALLAGANELDPAIRTAVINHGGGHHNHMLFWDILNAGAPNQPEGRLAELITSAFGSVEAMTEALKKASMSVFGSGWGWLVYDNGALAVISSPNQESPLMRGQVPLIGIDVWEHAYYLRYQNRRAEYVDAVLANLNWQAVAARLPA